MSQISQRQTELLDHLYENLRAILKTLFDFKTERLKLFTSVNTGIKPVLEDPTHPDKLPIETLMGALDSTPTSEDEGPPYLLDLTCEIIDISFKIKQGIDAKINTEDTVKEWIKAYIRRKNLVNIKIEAKIYECIDKLHQMLGVFRVMLESEEGDNTKKDKKKSEKKEKGVKVRKAKKDEKEEEE
jgi:hypothetical protein